MNPLPVFLQVVPLCRCFGCGPLRISFARDDRSVTVVDDLSFDLFPGETLGLVGESGSGKTMTALAISGLLSPAANVERGQITLLSKSGNLLDLSKPSSVDFQIARGAEIGFIFQEPGTSLNPVMPCGGKSRKRFSCTMAFPGTKARSRRWSGFRG